MACYIECRPMRAINVQIPDARRVLDFGCGSGWVLAEAKYQNIPHRVGVDCAVDSVRTASQNTGLDFAVADGLHLPFRSETFDVVIGHVSMPYMNTSGAFAEIYRVLRPGGSIFLTVHSFFYLRQRLQASVRRQNWKDILFCGYMAVNGLLNHFSLPQMQLWWKRRVFETVNTPGGLAKAARKQGFAMVSVEYEPARIFFAITARKAAPNRGAVLPAPGWSAGCPLSTPTTEKKRERALTAKA